MKPENILLDEDDEGNICSQVADFGSSAIRGQLRIPEGTPLWNAPELQIGHRHYVSAEDIISSDLYSFGLLAAHVLVPKADLAKIDLFLLEPTRNTTQTLRTLQKGGSLGRKLISVAATSNIPPVHLQLLDMILIGALHSDPSLRVFDWRAILDLVEKGASSR